MLAESALRDISGQQVSVNITRRGAEKFLAGSGHGIDELEQLAKDGKPLPHFR